MRKGTAGITAAAGVVGLVGGFVLSRFMAKPEADKPTVTVLDHKGPSPAKPTAPARPTPGRPARYTPDGRLLKDKDPRHC